MSPRLLPGMSCLVVLSACVPAVDPAAFATEDSATADVGSGLDGDSPGADAASDTTQPTDSLAAADGIAGPDTTGPDTTGPDTTGTDTTGTDTTGPDTVDANADAAADGSLGDASAKCLSDKDCPVPFDPCGIAVCTAGQCSEGPPKSCDDGNPCTQDKCDGKGGCTHTATAGPCPGGTCDGGTCKPGSAGGLLSVSGGSAHTCAVRGNGELWCWGANDVNQLGVGSEPSAIPVQVWDTKAFLQVAGGIYHTCAVQDDHQVVCWGYSPDGRAGPGGSSINPKKVEGLPKAAAAQVAVGHSHTCALLDGAFWCWGLNDHKQLGKEGDGGPLPVQVTLPALPPATSWVSLRANYNSTCAGRSDGAVVCWGQGAEGQLGTGGNADGGPTSPVVQLPTGGVTSLAVGYTHVCGVAKDGKVLCWGANDRGQLGNGSGGDSAVPTPTASLGAKAIAVAAGDGFSCAVLEGGTVRCWGANDVGQLGTGPGPGQQAPAPAVAKVSGALGIAAGRSHACAWSAKFLWCWGLDHRGQVGDGKGGLAASPVVPVGLGKVSQISAGGQHTCARAVDGSAWCWGDGGSGQLGTGQQILAATPQKLQGMTEVLAVEAGIFHACARVASGKAYCWGTNTHGQLGTGGGQALLPTAVVLSGKVLEIAAGLSFTCFLVEGGQVHCSGATDLSEEPATTDVLPKPVAGLTDAIALTADATHACAVKKSGGVVCWGQNPLGQLGIGTTKAASGPTLVLGGKTFSAVSAGYDHTCAVGSDKQAWCWGDNPTGALGIGPGDGQLAPAALPGVGDVTAIAAGHRFSCAIRAGGAVWCAGGDGLGQLGAGKAGAMANVLQVVPQLPAAQAISAGMAHVCTVGMDQTARCWGDGGNGQLGDGEAIAFQPTTVLGLP